MNYMARLYGVRFTHQVASYIDKELVNFLRVRPVSEPL